jgi:hypothetical protein
MTRPTINEAARTALSWLAVAAVGAVLVAAVLLANLPEGAILWDGERWRRVR